MRKNNLLLSQNYSTIKEIPKRNSNNKIFRDRSYLITKSISFPNTQNNQEPQPDNLPALKQMLG
jgi:hypothetical protein